MQRKLNSMLNSQRGAAIIVALFVTALVAMTAVIMLERLHIDLRRTELIFNDNKARMYAEGSIAWAIELLNSNLKHKKPDKVTDIMPVQSPVNDIEDIRISTTIEDQEGLFNLNNLTDPESQQSFVQLVKVVEPTMKVEDINALIVALRDWISPAGTNNQLDTHYAKQSPPYAAPHRLMASISELRLVKGITPELYKKLSPFITALPEVTNLNINTAPPQLLMTLSPNLSLEAAAAIVNYRKQHPFTSIEHFKQLDIVKNHPFNDQKISVLSSYFLVKTNVKVDSQQMTLYTLLHRMLNNAEPVETIIWQTKGTL